MAKAVLVLEDGRIFEGIGFGAQGVQSGELVFNTAMFGYQEILTDPSYYRQIVVMTAPHIGNTGVNLEDTESRRSWLSGFIVRSLSTTVSNWRNQGDLDSYLREQGVIGLSNIATRALVRHIRQAGALRAALAHGDAAEDTEALLTIAQQSASMVGANLVDEVTTSEAYHWTQRYDQQWYMNQAACRPQSSPKIIAYDFGIKHNILRLMSEQGLDITVVPAHTPYQEVLALHPDGIFLSNGPGDPMAVDYAIENVKQLLGKVPIFGICLGHQILALALGATTQKMHFGHHGCNQPVKNLLTNVVEISAHNHGFAVNPDSDLADAEVTHINLNDNTIEGIRHTGYQAFSVQYHPEASPGPHDSLYLFDEFLKALRHKQS